MGGLFLVWKSTHEIHDKLEGDEGHGGERAVTSFSSVITQIVLLDIVFSLDSVITAVGMVNNIPIMIAAVLVAVVFMMFFSGPDQRLRRTSSDSEDARAQLLTPYRRYTDRGRPWPTYPEGLHLLRHGLLGVRRSPQYPNSQGVNSGQAASALRQAKGIISVRAAPASPRQTVGGLELPRNPSQGS